MYTHTQLHCFKGLKETKKRKEKRGEERRGEERREEKRREEKRREEKRREEKRRDPGRIRSNTICPWHPCKPIEAGPCRDLVKSL
jgi:hypothetical protein